MCHGGLEVTAHAGGDPRGVRVRGSDAVAHLPQAGEGGVRVSPERGDCHHAAKAQRGRAGDGVRERLDLVDGHSSPTLAVGQRHLNRHVQDPAHRAGSPVQGAHHLGPVDRLHDIRVPRDRPRLVALELADEVDAQTTAMCH